MMGWQFARVAEGWEWQRLGEAGKLGLHSTRVFATLLECLDDAARNGYSFGMPAGNVAPNRMFGD